MVQEAKSPVKISSGSVMRRDLILAFKGLMSVTSHHRRRCHLECQKMRQVPEVAFASSETQLALGVLCIPSGSQKKVYMHLCIYAYTHVTIGAENIILSL
jgi:hypothetical protein